VGRIHWHLEEWLDAHNLTRYQLAQAMPGNTHSWLTTLYRMGDPKRLDLTTLATILHTLRELTQEPVNVADLLTYDDGD